MLDLKCLMYIFITIVIFMGVFALSVRVCEYVWECVSVCMKYKRVTVLVSVYE